MAVTEIDGHFVARLGARTQVAFGPDVRDQVAARFAVVEARTLLPSHHWSTLQLDSRYPRDLQGRTYTGAFGQPSAMVVATQLLEPMYVLDPTRFPWGGPPICTRQGWVIAGNHRAILLQRAALWRDDERQVDAYQRYREALFGSLPDWGLTPADVLSHAAPVLVRVLDDAQWRAVSPVERDRRLRRLNILSDRPPTKAYDFLSDGFAMATALCGSGRGHDSSAQRLANERLDGTINAAGSDASREAISALRTFVVDGSLNATLRGSRGPALLAMLQRYGAVTFAEYPALVDPVHDRLSPAGRSRVTWMMRALLIEDRVILGATSRRVFQKFEGNWDRLLAAAYGHVGVIVRARLRDALAELANPVPGTPPHDVTLAPPLSLGLAGAAAGVERETNPHPSPDTRSASGRYLAACIAALPAGELGRVIDRWLLTLVPAGEHGQVSLFSDVAPSAASGEMAERAVLAEALAARGPRRRSASLPRVPNPEQYLTSSEWAALEPLMPSWIRSSPYRVGGRPPHSSRALAAGIVYVIAHGATADTVVPAWQTLPRHWLEQKLVCRRTTLQRRLALLDSMPGGRGAFFQVAAAIAAARQ